MLGLIKKDLLMMKSNIKLLIIILIITILISMNGTMNITFMPAFISIMLIMSTFSYDEYNKWDAYAITFPNSRKNIITAKYLTMIILTVFINILSSLILVIAASQNYNSNIQEILLLMTVTTIVVLFIGFLIYPFLFKFGAEKGRIGFFIAVFGLTAFAQKVQLNFPQTFLTFCLHYGFIIALLLLIVTGIISYQISKQIYINKEY